MIYSVDSVSELITILLAQGRFSAKDLANAAGCSRDKIYDVRKGEADLWWEEAKALGKYLSMHEINAMPKLMMDAAYTIRLSFDGIMTNGRIGDEWNDDQIADAMVAKGWRENNAEKALKGCEKRDEVTERLRAEIKQHLNGH